MQTRVSGKSWFVLFLKDSSPSSTVQVHGLHYQGHFHHNKWKFIKETENHLQSVDFFYPQNTKVQRQKHKVGQNTKQLQLQHACCFIPVSALSHNWLCVSLLSRALIVCSGSSNPNGQSRLLLRVPKNSTFSHLSTRQELQTDHF